MVGFTESEKEERDYLDKTLAIIKSELEKEKNFLNENIASVRDSRKKMWEESVHFSDDFDRIPEMNHYLSEVNRETMDYSSTKRHVERYNKMIKTPYFGRFDFLEENCDDIEKIYIGMHNLINDKEDEIIIYDWRAPISSIFYRCEIGPGAYKSPMGMVNGRILLKRQYKIQNSKLKYFFDSSIRINDEILQEVLSRNSSKKMKSIVQTIQKEQDKIIRDTENELLIVQGVAGSGKTSIALHRIAFLLYEGLNSKINVNNIIIISPNDTFSNYISNVLPELGEENVEQITFDDIMLKILEKRFLIENRAQQLETLIQCKNYDKYFIDMDSILFKGSKEFLKILDRLIQYCEKSLICFKDIYYDGEIIETRQQLKSFFLSNRIKMPIMKRLQRIENMILNKIHPLRKKRLKKIEEIVERANNHMLEIKPFSRLLAIKEAKNFMENIHTFTQVDYMSLYKLLFNKKGLLSELSQGIEIPKNIDKIIEKTKEDLEGNYISYEDAIALSYIKLKLYGNDEFSQIKQVVVDEAQDYYPLQYEIFKILFKDARYTILGDFNQTIEKESDKVLYDDIEVILNKRKSVKLFMNKGYRSSFEINTFTQKLLNNKNEFSSFERHENEPNLVFVKDEELLDEAVAANINEYFKKGYESVAVICKTLKEAKEIQERLSNLVSVKLLDDKGNNSSKTALVIPAYLAKGLEFDAVIVYNVSKENYKNDFHKRLLYIACTRALHQLSIYYTGEKSVFI